jgi:hypothetical protein
MRRALSVGVGSFTEADRDLPYAKEPAEGLRTALTGTGYCGDPVPLNAEGLGTAVHGRLETGTADDVLIVHVITHGEVSEGAGRLYMIGADGPLTLFLLDNCQAGEAARLPWQGRLADGSARAWVIGASGPVVSLHTSVDGHLLVAAGREAACFRHAEFVRRDRNASAEREEGR